MSTYYLLQNQQGYFLGGKGLNSKGLNSKNSGKNKIERHYEWLDGQEAQALFRSTHKDEAINLQFEVNSQDVELRIFIKEYAMNSKGLPDIPSEDLPPPLPKQPIHSSPNALFDENHQDQPLADDTISTQNVTVAAR